MNTKLINEQDLIDKLDGLINGWENETVEFKEANKDYDKEKR